MAYNGSVELISGIKQKNDQNFPLVDASAVRVDDNTRMDEALSQINGMLGEAKDKTTNVEGGVINGLLSAAPFTRFDDGGYRFTNGHPYDAPGSRIRTQKSTISTAKKIACIDVAPGYKFGICVHSGGGQSLVYHGAWDGVDFYTDIIWQTGPVFFGNIDKTAQYQYSITIAKVDDSSISTSDGPNALKVYYATDDALETEGVPADAKTTGDAITNAVSTASTAVAALGPDSTLSVSGKAADAAATGNAVQKLTEEIGNRYAAVSDGVVSAMKKGSAFTSFSAGGIDFTNGDPDDTAPCIRTLYISNTTIRSITAISCEPGYKFAVFFYIGAGAARQFPGAWDGAEFYKPSTNIPKYQTTPVFLAGLDKTVEYRAIIVLAKADDSSISTTDAGNAIRWYATDANLETAGVPADAKAVGDAIAAITPDTPNVNDYYFTDDYLEDRVAAIREIMSTVGNAGDSFIFYTDPHYYAANGTVQNGMQSAPLTAYLMKRLNIGCSICGGDLYDSFYNSKTDAQECFSAIRTYANQIWDKSFYIVGNHEFNNADNNHPQNQLSRAFIYQSTAKDKERQFGDLEPNTNAYYIDNVVQKIRYFFLPAESNAWISIYAVTWFAKQLERVPDGYTVVVLSHIGLMHENGDADDPGFANLVLPQIDLENPTAGSNRWAHVWGAMDAAKAHTTYTINNTTYDYTGKDFEVACAITGHTHVDDYAVTTGGIPIICVVLDRAGRTSAETVYGHMLRVCRKIGTIGEQALDVVHIDTENKKIYMTRIGGCVLNAVLDIPEDKKGETNPGQYAISVVDANDPYYDPDTGTIGDSAVRYDAKGWVLHSIDEGYCDREFSY